MPIKVGFPPDRVNYTDKANNLWVPDAVGECSIPDAFLQEFRDAGFIYPAPSGTGARPTVLRVGIMYFDTTLNRPIWVNAAGNGWVFSDGTAA